MLTVSRVELEEDITSAGRRTSSSRAGWCSDDPAGPVVTPATLDPLEFRVARLVVSCRVGYSKNKAFR